MTPHSYRLHLEPDLDSFTFSGTVIIRFSPSDGAPFVLDAVDLDVKRCSLRDDSGAVEVAWRLEDGALYLEPESPPAGVCELEIDYTGAINDLMTGFYRSRYVVDGQTYYLATTQFEERDARRAFPCVDHPAAKAVFEIELLAPAGQIAIANTPVASTEGQADGRTLFRFEPTPPMSTYLVYFAVGPFDVEVDNTWRVPIRVAVSPGKGSQARQSLEYARKSISYLEQFVGIDYPLGKLDSIGVADFAFGAMENFGAIAYRENLLLTDESSTTRAEVESMMGIAAHEIAHMWFGDLVSPAGWRYVWLNEAFATYFGHVTADHWYPEWRTIARFATGAMSSAMGRDGLPGTFSIELDDDEIEIDASTAPIVYQKGASVLRMVHEFYGDSAFRTATQSFLRAFEFSAVDTQGFLSEFGSALDRSGSGSTTSAAELLGRWIGTPGFPLIRVRRADGSLHIAQERFDYLAEGPQAPSDWNVPITGIAAGGSGDDFDFMLAGAQTEIDVPESHSWVKLNRHQSGYYRVFYEEPETWDALGRAASAGELPPLDRYGLVADLGAFVRAGLVSVERYLAYLRSYCEGETDPLVVAEIAQSLASLHAVLPDDDRVVAAGLELLGAHRDRALSEPSDDEPYDHVLLRDPVLSGLVLFGDETVTRVLVERARTIRAGGAVHADSVPLALHAAVAVDPSFIGWIRSRLEDPDLSEAKSLQFTRALAGVRDEEGIAEVLACVTEQVPDRNRLHFLRPAAANPYLHPQLWRWFTDHFESMAGIHPYHLGAMIATVVPTAGLGHESEAADLLERYLAGSPTVGRGVVRLSLERLEVNRRLRR